MFPAISLSPLQGATINIGSTPFKHQPASFKSLVESAAAHSTFSLQVFDVTSLTWVPVQKRHQLLDENDEHRLAGRWIMNEGVGNVILNSVSFKSGGELQNHLAGPAGIISNASWVFDVDNPSKTFKDIWGYKVTVVPQFPRSFEEVPFLKDKLIEQVALFEEEDVHLNTELVRFMNTISRKRGLDRRRVFDLKWKDVAPRKNDLFAWPLLNQALFFSALE